MDDLTGTVSVEPIVHEVIAPHCGAAIGGPTDRRPVSATPFVNIPQWVSSEMRAYMRLLEDPAKTAPTHSCVGRGPAQRQGAHE